MKKVFYLEVLVIIMYFIIWGSVVYLAPRLMLKFTTFFAFILWNALLLVCVQDMLKTIDRGGK